MRYCIVISLCLSLVRVTPLQITPRKQLLKDVGSRIINGERAEIGQFPWQVALILNYEDGFGWFCGGTIIDEQWILTAGHCVDGADYARAIIGTLVWSDYSYPRINSTELILHEEFGADNAKNDIGLIKLPEPLNFNETIQSIRLSQEPLGEDIDVTVSGWGAISDNGIPSDELNFVRLRTISNTDCQNIYQNDEIFDTMVCANSADPDVLRSPCSGDSGGPVIVEGEEPELVAVVSFVSDNGCKAGDPSGYARVSSYIDWIREKTGIEDL